MEEPWTLRKLKSLEQFVNNQIANERMIANFSSQGRVWTPKSVVEGGRKIKFLGCKVENGDGQILVPEPQPGLICRYVCTYSRASTGTCTRKEPASSRQTVGRVSKQSFVVGFARLAP